MGVVETGTRLLNGMRAPQRNHLLLQTLRTFILPPARRRSSFDYMLIQDRAERAGYFWGAPTPEYNLRQRRHLVSRRERSKLHLWLCPYCSRQVRCLLEGERYVHGMFEAHAAFVLTIIATGIEGIFRLSGSEKRIKELKQQFDSPDRYGKGLVWDGYTVHDAANVLRRYLNDLPEPVVPLDLYEKFRDPLRGATKQAVGDAEGPQFVENFDEKAAIEKYQKLITELPPLNRQLLLYILDLLAVFAAKADENRMNSQNLAAIFQPGMLSHPNHAMAPEEYRLNQCVIIFLIENQDHFLIGMPGTGADEMTKKEVESGTPAATPLTPTSNRRSGTGVNRSASNASAGAQSVYRDGQIRRNRSVNSRHSKRDESTTPNSPALSATQTGGGLGRSNTVPSKKSPAIQGGKFRRGDQSPGPQSPAHLEPLTQAHPSPRMSEQSSLAPPVGGAASISAGPGRSQERLLGVPNEQHSTPQKERNLQSLFQRSPTDEGKRQPNKLKKKRIPGSMNHSAHSSNASLPQVGPSISPSAEGANPIEHPPLIETEKEQAYAHSPATQQTDDLSSTPTPRASQVPTNSTLHPESTLMGQKSPPSSVHSSYNELSESEHGADGQERERERKKWRMSRPKGDNGNFGAVYSQQNTDASQSSIASAIEKPRGSLTGDNVEASAASTVVGTSDTQDPGREGKEEPKGPIGWIRNKMREAKENAEQRRTKSPPEQGSSLLSRGRSLDMKREPLPAEKREPLPASPEKKEVVAADEKSAPVQQAPPPPTVTTEAQAQPPPEAPKEQ